MAGYLFKTVSVPQPGNDMIAVVAYFFTQTCDIDIDGAVENDNIVAPYLIENIGTGKNRSLMFEKESENFKFFFGKLYFFPVDGTAFFATVDL